jgi:hypothetical protein
MPQAGSARPAILIALATLLTTAAGVAGPRHGDPDPGDSAALPPPPSERTVPGDLCSAPLALGRGEQVTVDLCSAWNDYDPGEFSCSPCALPGPEVVAVLDTQAGEKVRLDLDAEGALDVRVYVATECTDPVGTCLVASDGSGDGFQWTVNQGGTLYLYVDTAGECGGVTVTRHQAATAAGTDLTALKAIYR